MKDRMLQLLRDDGVTGIEFDDQPESLHVKVFFDRDAKHYVGAFEFMTARKSPGIMALTIRSHLGTHMEEIK